MLLMWREKTPGGWRRFLVCYWCGERRTRWLEEVSGVLLVWREKNQVIGGGFWCVTGVEREDTR